MRLRGRRYDQGQPVSIEVADGRVTSVEAVRGTDKGTLPWIAPALVDLQVNGYGGCEFTRWELDGDAVEQVSLALDPLGVAHYLPTVITQSHELLLHALGTIAEALESRAEVARRAAGIHLEGPFISAQDGPRGAHPIEHCRKPDWNEFQQLQDAARGHIKLITLSPEYDAAPDFTRAAVSQGVLVSIGHTNANSQQIEAVVEAGACLSTHLGNGAHATIHRHPNYIWDQLAEDRLTASLIVDGYHLPPAVVKSMVRAKTPQRVVLVSDLTGLAGAVCAEPGLYEQTGLGAIEVLPDGRAVVAGQREYLAGATTPLIGGVANVMRFAGVDLAAAIDMASARPASLLQLEDSGLDVGDRADLIQFHLDENQSTIQILATFNGGQCVFGEAVTEPSRE